MTAVGQDTQDLATAEEATIFVQQSEQRLEDLARYAERLNWVKATYITEDTEALAAGANEALTAAQVEIALGAARFLGVDKLDYDTARKLDALRSSIPMPAPSDPAKNSEQAEIGARLSSMFSKGQYCTAAGVCRDLGELEAIIENSHDPDELLEAWSGWRSVSPAMKPLYERQVELANEGANELGFHDLGAANFPVNWIVSGGRSNHYMKHSTATFAPGSVSSMVST